MGDQPIDNGDETCLTPPVSLTCTPKPKVVAEQIVLQHNGVDGLYTCAVRRSGIWCPGDQTMFRKVFEPLVKGQVRALMGNRHT